MCHKHLYVLISTLAVMLTAFVATPAIAQQAGASVDSVTPVGAGRYRITGTALDARGNAACALALASGRCMFTCGPGSLRCEGGTDPNIPFGRFDLTDLPTEPNGTIILQVFVQGNISFAGAINPGGGGGGGTARWSAYNDTCCRNTVGTVFTSTYEVTVDGVTKRSVSNSCTSNSSFEGFAITTPGTKSYTSRVSSSGCGTFTGSGTVAMVNNTCYQFQLHFEGGSLVNRFGTINCPSSANGNTIQEAAEATPMAIFPMLPSADDGSEPPKATYQPIQRP